MSTAPPLPPPRFEETASNELFRALAPRLPRREPPAPPPELAPWEIVQVPRSRGTGHLAGTLYAGPEPAAGAVLLLPPWLPWGRTYFHRNGRVEALRAAGYHALALDLPGFGGSGPAAGYYHYDVEDALVWLGRRFAELPLHVWGISSGGYWAHFVLSRRSGVTAAVFEDVSHHLLQWSWRTAPLGRPFYVLFRVLLRRAYRYLDLRRHAPCLRVERAAYVSGALDRGVRPEDTRTLARLAGAPCLVVPGAGHLQAIKQDNEAVLSLALATLSERPPAAGS